MKSLLLEHPEVGWAQAAIPILVPGAHVIVLGSDESVGIEGRFAGFEVRDTISVLSPGAVRLAFLFRKPLARDSVVSQILETGTGAINVDACRISTKGEKLSISRSDPFHNKDGSQKWNPTSSGAIERDQHPLGRWPTNVVLIHGPACGDTCDLSCPVLALDTQARESAEFGGVSRFFPQFTDDRELLEWLSRLIAA